MKLRKNHIYIILFIIVITLVVVIPFLNETVGSKISSLLTTLTAIIGAVALFIQFKKDKMINQASFMTEYSQQFYEPFYCDELFEKLDNALDNKELTAEDFDSKTKHDLVNYLIWCEGLCSLVLQNVLQISQIDSLFSYRFFLITNNKYVQETELIPYQTSYVEIVKVHKLWTKYKRSKNLAIICDENNLTDKLEQSK